tara:strand:+ start:2862 stop:3362 length:501 start_codon:yes stop_codon:yes gene_type:complete
MSSFKIRLQFRQVVALKPDEVEEQIQTSIAEQSDRCELKRFSGFLCLRIPEQDQHFWSPRLHLNLESTGEGETLIRGVYGPNANVWALFLYGYIIVGFLGFVSGIFAFCQWSIGSRPWGFWIFGGFLAAALALYAIAQIGQKLGAQQTFLLHQVYESAIGTPVTLH